MSSPVAALFQSVHQEDILDFWPDRKLDAKAVAAFLHMDKEDLARISGLVPASIRFDDKMPREMRERVSDIANVCNLVAQALGGDAARAQLWYRTVNSELGGASPRDLILAGEHQRLQRLVVTAAGRRAVPGEGEPASY